jgi:hypothetical protein
MFTWFKKCIGGWFFDSKRDRRRMDTLTRRFLRAKLKKAGLRESALCRHFRVARLDALRMSQLDEAMGWIRTRS